MALKIYRLVYLFEALQVNVDIGVMLLLTSYYSVTYNMHRASIERHVRFAVPK